MPAEHRSTEAVVRRADGGEVTRWDDAVRGRLSFRTLADGALDPAVTMCTGMAWLDEGGWLGQHRHAWGRRVRVVPED